MAGTFLISFYPSVYFYPTQGGLIDHNVTSQLSVSSGQQVKALSSKYVKKYKRKNLHFSISAGSLHFRSEYFLIPDGSHFTFRLNFRTLNILKHQPAKPCVYLVPGFMKLPAGRC